MMFSGSDARKFEEIHTKMSRCIEMITMAASVSTNAMVACKFEQGKRLEAKLEDLGGAESVARDPQLRQQAQPMTTADMERVESEISRVRGHLSRPPPYRLRPPCHPPPTLNSPKRPLCKRHTTALSLSLSPDLRAMPLRHPTALRL